MPSARPTFALLGLSAALVAADPFVGTWKRHAAKSTVDDSQIVPLECSPLRYLGNQEHVGRDSDL